MEPAEKKEQVDEKQIEEKQAEATEPAADKSGKEEESTTAEKDQLILIDAIKHYLEGLGVDPEDKNLTRDMVI